MRKSSKAGAQFMIFVNETLVDAVDGQEWRGGGPSAREKLDYLIAMLDELRSLADSGGLNSVAGYLELARRDAVWKQVGARNN